MRRHAAVAASSTAQESWSNKAIMPRSRRTTGMYGKQHLFARLGTPLGKAVSKLMHPDVPGRQLFAIHCAVLLGGVVRQLRLPVDKPKVRVQQLVKFRHLRCTKSVEI